MTKDFQKKFRIKDLTIKEFNYWILSVRPQQPTLGSMVITLKRTCEYMKEITEEESKELSVVFEVTENLLGEAFKYDKINYLCLMMMDEQVHFHVIPRYEKTMVLGEIKLEDMGWPGPPDLSVHSDEEQLLQSLKKILIKE